LIKEIKEISNRRVSAENAIVLFLVLFINLVACFRI